MEKMDLYDLFNVSFEWQDLYDQFLVIDKT